MPTTNTTCPCEACGKRIYVDCEVSPFGQWQQQYETKCPWCGLSTWLAVPGQIRHALQSSIEP